MKETEGAEARRCVLVAMLIAMVVAQAGLPSSPVPGALPDEVRDHGLLFGVDLGVGYSTFSGLLFGSNPSDSSGLTLTGGLHAGYILSSHFVIGVHLLDAVQPNTHSAGLQSSSETPFELNLLAVGPELTFVYRRWTFAVTPEFLRVDTRFGEPESSGTGGYQGWGIGVAIAKQWPIAPGLRGGLAAQFNYAYLGYGYVETPDGFRGTFHKKLITLLLGSLGGVISF